MFSHTYMKEIPHKDYFEGILQIRNETKELLTWVRNRVKKDQKAVITKEKKVKGGVDMYFSDQHYLRAIAKKINQTFTGILKVTATLHTRKKGDDLYRITAFFKLLPFKKGDKFILYGDEIEIISLDSRARIKILSTGKRKDVSLEELLKARRA